jgi:hypothetical protein
MKLTLGIPEIVGSAALPRRLAWLTGARLLFMSIALALVGSLYLGGQYETRYYTLRAGLFTFGGGFVLTALYAVILRRGGNVEKLADAQLVLDQVTWTAVVYLTGGAASGATSFYGLSCLVGAALTGLRGAGLAAVSGGICYGALVTALAKRWILPPPDQPPAMYLPSSEECCSRVPLPIACAGRAASCSQLPNAPSRPSAWQLSGGSPRAWLTRSETRSARSRARCSCYALARGWTKKIASSARSFSVRPTA